MGCFRWCVFTLWAVISSQSAIVSSSDCTWFRSALALAVALQRHTHLPDDANRIHWGFAPQAQFMLTHIRVFVFAVTATILATGCYAPQAGSPIPSADGARLYRGSCASCHGQSGAGDGPMIATLTVAPTDLRTLSARNGGVFPRVAVRQKIDGRNLPAAHGTSDMPVWGWQFAQTDTDNRDPAEMAETRIEAVVDYLENLQSR